MAWQWLRKIVGCPPVPPEPPVPPPDPNRKLHYAYYGTGDGQVLATEDHVNLVHIGAWGDWATPQGRINLTNVIINYAQEAKAAGVAIMFTMDWCLYTQTNPRHLLEFELSRGYLDAFFTRVRDEGLLDSVVAFYPIDEPNIPEISLSASDITSANGLLRAVAGFYWDPLHPLPLAVIYGPSNNLPGVSSYDWCGIDNYGSNIFTNGQYNQMLAQLNTNQKTIYVPGGANPWQEDPMPFYTHALQDSRCTLIMPFTWLSAGDTVGIGVNGMAAQYEQVGTLILNQ